MKPKLLRDSRVYLSGPMDFVASREDEKKQGWRNRIGEFLRELGVNVFDPWFKPEVHGLKEYGIEGERTTSKRNEWSFEPGDVGAGLRASCSESFWPAMHIDLRMVDTSDFVIAYCPTNIYSVGTPHEIILCRQQRKPVLFVSPPVTYPALNELQAHLDAQDDKKALELLEKLQTQVPIKQNLQGVPSLWYMPLIGGEHFFDGFGFAKYRKHFDWQETEMDLREMKHPPKKPLLPFIEKLNQKLPQKWSRTLDKYVPNDDWLLWNLKKSADGGSSVDDVYEGRKAKQ
jgi:hypothetical protein